MTETDTTARRELADRLVALTRDLIIYPSYAGRPDEIDRCLEFIRNHIDPLPSVVVQRHEQAGHPSLVAFPQGIAEPRLVLCGHIDVIEHPDPRCYHSRLEEGRIVGPGAGDMKGQVAILLELFRHFHTAHPGISLGLILTSDEERGGEQGVRYLLDDVGLRCAEAIIPDGGGPNRITVAEKGILHLEVVAHGQAGHAARPWLSENPLDKLMAGLACLREWFDGQRREDANRWYSTCTVTIVSTRNLQVNRIPAEASAVLDIRFTPEHTVESLHRQVRELFAGALETRVIIGAEPSELQPDPLFQTIAEEVTGRPVEEVREDGGSDARFFCRFGIPVIVSRPAIGNVHAEDEWIDIDSMVTWHEIARRFIERKLLNR